MQQRLRHFVKVFHKPTLFYTLSVRGGAEADAEKHRLWCTPFFLATQLWEKRLIRPHKDAPARRRPRPLENALLF